MLGLSRDVVLGFVRAGFVSPTRGPRNAYRFGFQDVVLLRTAQTLRSADIPARRIHRSLKRLRDLLPATAPLTGLRITAIGDDIAVREAGQDVVLESGQLLLDFEVASGPGAVLRFPGRHAADLELDAAAWVARGHAVAATDRAGASAAYRRALAIDPSGVTAWLAIAALPHEAGDFVEALAVYDKALVASPDAPELHYNRAIVLEDLARPDDALRAYQGCIALDPGFADAHWNAARLYEQLGVAQQALRHFSAYRRLQR